MELNAVPCDPEANSYLTLEEADAMMDGFLSAEKWDALKSEAGEATGKTIRMRLLANATRLIDRYRTLPPRQKSDQALAWPTEKEPSEHIPRAVKLAVCEWIDAHLQGPQFQALKRLQAEGVTSMSQLGQSSAFREDPSLLPAGARRELDKLIDTYDAPRLGESCPGEAPIFG